MSGHSTLDAEHDPPAPQWAPLFQGTQHVDFRSHDGHLHELWWSADGGWQHSDLTGVANASLAAGKPEGYTFRDESTQHVIYSVGDGVIHELRWDPTGWHEADLTVLTGAPPARGESVAAYTFESQGTQHVIYQGDLDGHVHELWWDHQDGWLGHHHDLTIAGGGPDAADVPSAFADDDDSTQRVDYRSSNGQLHELRWQSQGNFWAHSLLSTDPAVPVAVSGLSSYVSEPGGDLHLDFRAADARMHELLFRAGVGWQHIGLSAQAGGPESVGSPTAYPFEAQGTLHVVYRDTDVHVRELWASLSDGLWHDNDLTVAAGATTTADGEPAAYAFNDQNTQHVFYRTANGHIDELWWNQVQGWQVNDLTVRTGAPLAESDPTAYLF
jgi:hypothetical protein